MSKKTTPSIDKTQPAVQKGNSQPVVNATTAGPINSSANDTRTSISVQSGRKLANKKLFKEGDKPTEAVGSNLEEESLLGTSSHQEEVVLLASNTSTPVTLVSEESQHSSGSGVLASGAAGVSIN